MLCFFFFFFGAITIRDNTYGGRVCDIDESKYDEVIVWRLCNGER